MIPCVELGDRSPEQRKRPVCPPYSATKLRAISLPQTSKQFAVLEW